MAVTLTPDIEARLRTVAAQRGLPPEQTLADVLAEAEADFNDTIEGIRAGLEDVEAGRTVTLEEYRAEVMARRQERDTRKQAAR